MYKKLASFYLKALSGQLTTFEPLLAHASKRSMYRLLGTKGTCIAVFCNDVSENRAFINFANGLLAQEVKVPEVIWTAKNSKSYLIQDLGNQTLYDLYVAKGFSKEVLSLYKRALKDLAEIQFKAGPSLNTSKSPLASFDYKSIRRDLEYFKYCFLRIADISYSGGRLDDELDKLAEFLDAAPKTGFMYRDFQARNIMLQNKQLFYIDFQSGRIGAPQFDVASLLYQSSVKIRKSDRKLLLNHYLSQAKKYSKFDKSFLEHWPAFALLRLLQVLATYGVQGIGKRKLYFLKGIPNAILNTLDIMESGKIDDNYPELYQVLLQALEKFKSPRMNDKGLQVELVSFSYKEGIPQNKPDWWENGGGFVFDCRCIPNPGRLPELKALTGKDKEVKLFLDDNEEAQMFFESTSKLALQAIKKYQERNFTALSIFYGCTGGQHRSVYMTERLARLIKQSIKSVKVNASHRELER